MVMEGRKVYRFGSVAESNTTDMPKGLLASTTIHMDATQPNAASYNKQTGQIKIEVLPRAHRLEKICLEWNFRHRYI